MSIKEMVEHCIYTSTHGDIDYEVEEIESQENTVLLHANIGFLSNDLTKELRNKLIFVEATAQLKPEKYGASFFLHYLEPEEDTFMDDLVNSVSTDEEVADH